MGASCRDTSCCVKARSRPCTVQECIILAWTLLPGGCSCSAHHKPGQKNCPQRARATARRCPVVLRSLFLLPARERWMDQAGSAAACKISPWPQTFSMSWLAGTAVCTKGKDFPVTRHECQLFAARERTTRSVVTTRPRARVPAGPSTVPRPRRAWTMLDSNVARGGHGGGRGRYSKVCKDHGGTHAATVAASENHIY